MSFPAYAEYRDSNVGWLGGLPAHWKTMRFSRVVSIAEGQVDPRVEPYASMVLIAPNHIEGGTGRLVALETAADQGADSGKYQFATGEVIYSKIRPALAKVVLAPCDGLCSADMYPLRGVEGLTSPYLKWVLLCPEFTAWAVLESDRVAMPKINREKLNEFRLPIPSVEEQRTIAAFLDRETDKIDALVEAQERLIALLKEKRQAVISHAVTKGLDPSAPMKDSGVEWLGQVPAHWEVCSAKRVASVFVPQRNKPELNSDGLGIGWVTMDDMRQHDIRETHRWVSAEAAAVAGSSVLPAGSVIASCVGNFGVSSINRTQVIINQQLQAYIPSPSILAEWLAYSVRLGVGYFEQVATVATLPYVNQIGFGGLPLALPPLEEQRVILRNLEERVRSMGRLIEGAEAAVSLLNERRAALISAAVTGKIDVRGLVQTAEAA